MNTPRILLPLILTITILLAACGPAATPTPVLATSAKDIAGAWVSAEMYYYEFNEDGTWTHGTFFTNGDRLPTGDKGTFRFDGTRFMIQTTEQGDQNCADNLIGIYEVQVLASDKLLFVKIEDDCLNRVGTLSGLSKLP